MGNKENQQKQLSLLLSSWHTDQSKTDNDT